MSSLAGSSSPLFQENWAWVDKRLEELYYGYGLAQDNIDDYVEAGLLDERCAWVDADLQSLYDAEFNYRTPCPAPLSWVLYKEYPKQYCLEEGYEEGYEEGGYKSRAESDISDHSAEVEAALQMLNLEISLPTGINAITYPNSYLYAVADEIDDEFESCSSISHCSDASEMIFEIDDGYNSF